MNPIMLARFGKLLGELNNAVLQINTVTTELNAEFFTLLDDQEKEMGG